MVRPTPRHQTGAKRSHASEVGNRRVAERQGSLLMGGREVKQSTIDKWDRGTAAIEAQMAKWRDKRHTFEPMGRLDSCERCGMPKALPAHGE